MIPLLIGLAAVAGTGYFAGREVSEGIGEGLGNAASGMITGLSPVIAELGPMMVNGFMGAVEGGREAIEGNEKEFFQALTVITLIFGSFWAMKRSLGGPKLVAV